MSTYNWNRDNVCNIQEDNRGFNMPNWDHYNIFHVQINSEGNTCSLMTRSAFLAEEQQGEIEDEDYVWQDYRDLVIQGPYPMQHHVFKRGPIPRR